MHLTGNERLTPELQDRIFAEFLVPPALRNFVLHGIGSVDDAQYAASRVWASIAVPRGRLTKLRRISNGDGNMTYFDDTGPANHANPSATNAFRSYLMSLQR